MQRSCRSTIGACLASLARRSAWLVWLVWLAATGFALPGAAQTLPSAESATVNDFSRVLDAAAEADLAQRLDALKEETGVQMIVVTMPRLELYGGRGMRLDDYATALFNAWGIGDKDRDDGILMLVLTEAREVRIALGAGYDPIYDARAAKVLSTAVLPEFREGRLAEGIAAGITSARARLVLPFVEGRPVDLDEGFEAPASSQGSWLPYAVAGVFAWVVFMIRRASRRRRTCPRCSTVGLKRSYEVIEKPTLSATGTGMEHLTCTSCGFIDRKSYVIGMLSSNDNPHHGVSGAGTSGSGGDGGSSSGGGASDRW